MSRTFGGGLAVAAVLVIMSAQAAWSQQTTRGLSSDSSTPAATSNATTVGDNRSNDDHWNDNHWNDNRSNSGGTGNSDNGGAATGSNGQSQKSQSGSSAHMTKAERAAKAQQMRDAQRIERAKAFVNRMMNGEPGYGAQGNFGGAQGNYGGYGGNLNGSNIGQMLNGQGIPAR